MMDLSSLTRMVIELNDEMVMRIVNRALDIGVKPMEIIAAINEGLDEVGNLYQKGEYSISDLMMAGIIFEDVLKKERMQFVQEQDTLMLSKTILLGTIEGDIHDIGKTIFHSLAMSVGFNVIDLGINVPAEKFLEEAKRSKPDIIGISAVLTNAAEAVQRAVNLLKSDALTETIPIIIGGAMVSAAGITITGADAYARSAKAGLEICMAMKDEKEGEDHAAIEIQI